MNRWLSIVASICSLLVVTSGWAAPPSVACDKGDVVQVSAGFRHTCAVRADHSLWCWGFNFNGQLGTGTTTYEYTPVQVTALGHHVRRVAASDEHTCALTLDNSVWCWGDNFDGELGNGGTTSSLVPVAVSGLDHDVVDLAVGANTSCAIRGNHSLVCWGNNSQGALATGGTANALTPTPVLGLDGLKIVGVSQLRTMCALTDRGALYCWGQNENGSLGVGDLIARYTPTEVTTLTTPIRSVAAHGEAVCALDIDGNGSCWGKDDVGEVGNGTTVTAYPFAVPSPAPLTSLTHVTELTDGITAGCAIERNGQLSCWGSNYRGQLGVGDTVDRDVPTPVALAAVRSVTIGDGHVCAINEHDALYCWGDNSLGQLGISGLDSSPTPALVPMP
jgi:alpha-tubulin suppressor-like RCC1 family protein